MSLKRSSLITPTRLNQTKYTGAIRETPESHITLWVNDPVRRFTTTFDPCFLEAKMIKYEGKLEVPENVAKKFLNKKQVKELSHLIKKPCKL